MKSYEPGFTPRQTETLNILYNLHMTSRYATTERKIEYMKEIDSFLRLALSIGLVNANQYDKTRKKVFTLEG